MPDEATNCFKESIGKVPTFSMMKHSISQPLTKLVKDFKERFISLSLQIQAGEQSISENRKLCTNTYYARVNVARIN